MKRTDVANALRHLVRGLVAVGGLTLAASAFAALPRVHVEGRGSTTVVLASGLGDTLDVWSGVQSAIAENCTRTFAYNRAGYGGTPPAGGPRDAATIVGELRSELKKRGIAPPYVLVGHSLGGLYMQYFARAFPDDVAGLLLVDSTHWNQQLPANVAAATGYGRRVVLLYMPLIVRRELADSVRAGEQVHASLPARQVPTIVLSSTRGARGQTTAGQLAAALLQDEIAADFPAAVHLRVEASGHYIQHDRPEVVINSARQLVGCDPVASSASRNIR